MRLSKVGYDDGYMPWSSCRGFGYKTFWPLNAIGRGILPAPSTSGRVRRVRQTPQDRVDDTLSNDNGHMSGVSLPAASGRGYIRGSRWSERRLEGERIGVLLCRRRSVFREERKLCTLMCGGGVGLMRICVLEMTCYLRAEDPMGTGECCTTHIE